MILPLVQDFADALAATPREHPRYRILKLLDEAIRRDVHFIDRHPTTFFQCMWNTCWWYDCPEAAEHYQPPKGGWPTNGPAWQQPGPWLQTLLDVWLSDKEGATPGFYWLRSLRPPATPLGTAQQAVLRGHNVAVNAVACSPDGSLLASASTDKSIRLWNSHTGEQIAVMTGHERSVMTVAFSNDGRRIASGSDDQTVRIWDVGTGNSLLVLRGHEQPVTGVFFRSDSNTLITSSEDKTVRFWNTDTGKEIAALVHENQVLCVALAPDKERFASSDGADVYFWETATGNPLGSLRVADTTAFCMAFSPDGLLLVVGNSDEVEVIDIATGTVRWTSPRHDGFLLCVAFTLDGQTVLSGGSDKRVRLWDAQTGAAKAVFAGHEGNVSGLCILPDGGQCLRPTGSLGSPGQQRSNAVSYARTNGRLSLATTTARSIS